MPGNLSNVFFGSAKRFWGEKFIKFIFFSKTDINQYYFWMALLDDSTGLRLREPSKGWEVLQPTYSVMQVQLAQRQLRVLNVDELLMKDSATPLHIKGYLHFPTCVIMPWCRLRAERHLLVGLQSIYPSVLNLGDGGTSPAPRGDAFLG